MLCLQIFTLSDFPQMRFMHLFRAPYTAENAEIWKNIWKMADIFFFILEEKAKMLEINTLIKCMVSPFFHSNLTLLFFNVTII